jgi:ATP-binding cassette, subfamily B, multidrug efflux pump
VSRNRQLLRYFFASWRSFAAGGVALVATNLLALSIPKQIGSAVQHLRDATDASVIDVSVVEGFAWTIAALAIGAAVARVVSRVFIFNAGRQTEYRLRNELFAHLTRLDAAFFEGSATGDLTSRVVNDVTYVRLMFGFGVLHVVNTAIAYVVVLTLMVGVSPKLTLYSLLPYPIIFLTVRMFTKAVYTRTQSVQAQLSAISARAQENLSGAMVVRAFAIQQRENDAFRTLSDEYVERNLALARVRGALMPYMGVIGGLGMLIVLWLGGLETIREGISLGEYIEFSAYIVTLAWPTMAMGWVLSMWHRGTAAFDRLGLILDAEPAVAPPLSGAAKLPPLGPSSGEIRFEDVSLTYEDGTPALNGIDLTIPAGATVAIVGRTGGGKTSLVHLVARLRDPTTGAVYLDGMNLRDVDPVEVRGEIGYVPQDPFLFSMTVEDNIRLGERSGSGLTVDDAVRIAGLADDVEVLNNGLQTLVGERGVTLSGGQKQRVTIARAVLRAPRVLVLDDALASVDNRTERRILDELAKVMVGRTSLVVTHRFSALELVDDIIVVDEGRVAERGKHAELLALDGIYAGLLRRQQMEEEA